MKKWMNEKSINCTRHESYNDVRPSTSLKSGLIFDRFILFFVRMYGRPLSPETMNHFSSLCFGLCLGVDQYNNTIFTHFIVEVINVNPLDAFSLIFFLLLLQNQLDEKLLKFFVAVIDAELFERVVVKNFKTVNVKNTWKWGILLNYLAKLNFKTKHLIKKVKLV